MLNQDQTVNDSLRTRIADAWDWPDTSGSRFTAADQRRLRRLSPIFSSCAGIAVAAASIAVQHPLPFTIGLTAAGVFVGHYVAGMWVNRTRPSRRPIPR